MTEFSWVHYALGLMTHALLETPAELVEANPSEGYFIVVDHHGRRFRVSMQPEE